jgi:hypothetical protein
MFTLSRIQLLKFAAGGLVVISTLGPPARADELYQSLGPVGPHEQILTTVGNQRVIAFYMPGSDRCALHAVVWDHTGGDPGRSAARVRISLEPGQIVHIDSADNESLNLQCDKNAEKLSIVDTDGLVAFGITNQQPAQALKASASGLE